MKSKVLALAIAALFAAPAFADNETGLALGEIQPGLTYEAAALNAQPRRAVIDELLAAQARGDVVANAETGQTARDLAPQNYAVVTEAGKSRADVLAELRDAQRRGDIVVNGELGLKANELFSQAYGREVVASN